jgi:hypothetical protein
MNDKDKKAFENWELDVEWSTAFTSHRLAAVDAWQAACEYKQAELAHHIFKIEAENKKLREALLECPIVGEIHRDSNDRFKEWNLIHRKTLEALKEVGDK